MAIEEQRTESAVVSGAPAPTAAWDVQEYQFPAHGSVAERLRFALRYAVLAPSTHNTQPWRFALRNDAVHLYADRSRALPAIDPAGRELVMSCGAALLHLLIALRHFGYEARAEVLPDPAHGDFLARVQLGGTCEPTRAEDDLFHAIITRRTVRQRFEPIVLPAELLEALEREAELEGVRLRVVWDAKLKERLAKLIAYGDRVQFADRWFRRELSAWVRDNHRSAYDGIPGYALGLNQLSSLAEPLLVRGLDLGWLQGSWDHQLADTAPALVALGTAGDTIAEWIRAGQALARVLLRACANGVYASFLNQPIQVAGLRPRLREALGMNELPQALLRMGYASQGKPTPRRLVEEVVTE